MELPSLMRLAIPSPVGVTCASDCYLLCTLETSPFFCLFTYTAGCELLVCRDVCLFLLG
uniref:Uncharacterized protein n=1 Tax=Arundo donax TaxID=35708 RepID=A0A0A9GNI8_ARUDO